MLGTLTGQKAARFIRARGRATQADIGAALELDKSTVSRVLAGLAEKRLIRAVTELPASRRGGRKTVVWELDPTGPRAIVIAINYADITVAIMKPDGTFSARKTYPTPADGDPEKLLPLLKKAVERAAAEAEKPKNPGGEIVGVGVTTPGLVDGRSGTIVSCVNLPGFRDLALADRLTRATGRPVFVDNNARLALMAEMCYGAARGKRHVVCLFADYGLGLATADDGKILQGAHGLANDFHVIVDPRGPKCHCGRTGCVGALVGGRAIVDRLGLPRIKNIEDLCQAAEAGLPAVVEALKTAGFWLGRSATHLRDIFDPEIILLAGSVFRAGTVLLDATREAYEKRLIDDNRFSVPIVPAALGHDCAMVGAGVIGMSPLFGEE